LSIDQRLEDLNRRKEQARQGGGQRRVQAQHDRGKFTARERVNMLADQGSFEEFDALVMHRATDFGVDQQQYPGDSVVTGFAKIEEVEGLWSRFSAGDLATILALDASLLAAVLVFTRQLARLVGLPHEDEAVLVFCGSKKSLASGVPMAGALFPPAQVGFVVLPLMLFHQLQLIVCAALAQAYARSREARSKTEELVHAV
jgi:hypothetical protein